MNTRRKFLKNTIFSSLALPLLTSFDTKQYSIGHLKKYRKLTDESDYWKAIRMQFPLKDGQTYFNNGTLGPMPGYVLNKVIDNMHYAAVHGAETDYKGNGPQLLTGYFQYEDLRKKAGALINADFKEIVLTQNATFGMNFVANGMDLKPGDEIINTDQEHGGGYAAWRLLAKRRGCIYKMAKLPVPANDPDEIVQAIVKEITPKTKVIAVPHIVSGYGTVMPVKKICSEAKKRGIFVILDGAQTVGQVKVDVKDLGCDAYYSSLHKWLLAPAGSGLLYINEESMPDIWTTIASYQWENEEDHGFRLMQNGTGNPSILAGYEAAIDFYNTIGADKWIARIKHLGDYLRTGLKALNKVTIHSSIHPDMCAGMTTYSVEGISGPDLQKTMWEKEKLQPRSVGEEMVRHCVHIYNNEQEIDKALGIIAAI